MKADLILLLIGTASIIKAAPQFGFENNQPPQPYNFAYGVNDPNTGDVKEHKETVTATGVTEGEYRWLQPNGLFRVTRYTADDASGFRALVSEEPGQEVPNYYFNSLFGSVQTQTPGNFVSGTSGFSSSQDFQNQNFGSFQNQAVGGIQSFQPQVSGGLLPFQEQSFISSQNPQSSGFISSSNQGFGISDFVDIRNPSTISSQDFNTFNDGGIIDGGIVSGSIIDSGIVSGGIIDSGIVSGGIIDGGVIDNSNSNVGFSFNQQTIPTTASISSSFNNFGSTSNNFNNFGSTSNNLGSRGVSVVLGGSANRIQG